MRGEWIALRRISVKFANDVNLNLAQFLSKGKDSDAVMAQKQCHTKKLGGAHNISILLPAGL